MNIVLYQINPELDSERLMFNCLSYIKDLWGDKFPAEIYEPVFVGEVKADSIEDVFAIFNINHPKGYKDRSMSVSDVLEIVDETGESEFLFCDSIGFTKIEFDKAKVMSIRKNKFRED